MPRLILLLVATYYLASVTPAFAAQPATSSRVLSELTATLERYRAESRRLESRHLNQLRDIERAYYLKLNSLKTENPTQPASKGMFETTEEYKDRLARHRQDLATVRKANRKALTELERQGGLHIQVAKTEVSWLKAQLECLSPMAKTITRLQNNGCLVTGDTATITVQRPHADTFRFPVTINHKGTLYRETWTYPDRDRAETIWKLRHDIKVRPHYSPEPNEEGGVRLRLTRFIITDPQGKALTQFPVSTPAPFEAVAHLARIQSDELPAARILMSLRNAVEGPLPGMRFVFISPRSFDMGSPKQTPGRRPDERLHRVQLKRPFYMQTTEVTQAQWELVMGNNPSGFPFCGSDCPVENIYWQDAMRFITKLNAQYKGKGRFRLPTEAEWEYTARTGTLDPWVQSGEDAATYAWFRPNAGEAPHPVATKHANLWNIYDINGNVSEWCSDWYGPYPSQPISKDPQGPLNGEFRVTRGGSWFHGIDSIRGAHRNSANAEDKGAYIGFRLVLDIPPEGL
ncbi:formylglycine-generating enzyme family protein [Desulfoluna sp.]|uniref:formylglycine-generating enzyme family protein n=1 Tax=Desulfoluna sp. TaxID=2045199 RepID=UPI002637B2B7|nr:formylglycine-generating enzyme family protein [Desulfoluna sp.]